MNDFEFDAIALNAFGPLDVASERVWRGSIAVKKWDWLPTPGESLAMACLASAVMGGIAYTQAGNDDIRHKVRLNTEMASQPFESEFLAVSRITGIDRADIPDSNAESDAEAPPR